MQFFKRGLRKTAITAIHFAIPILIVGMTLRLASAEYDPIAVNLVTGQPMGHVQASHIGFSSTRDRTDFRGHLKAA